MLSERQRVEHLLKVHKNPQMKADEIQKAANILYFFDYYAYTYDPRINAENNRPIGETPFNQYEFQREMVVYLLDSITHRYDLLIEKSRDMGVSWTALIVLLHQWLYTPGFSAILGSRNVDYVDKPGSINTMFEKLRVAIRALPRFMRPLGFQMNKHATYLKLINPVNGNAIVGETANSEFGRAGRATVALLDELAFWETADTAWEACGQTTDTRWAVSTPNGMNNRFGKMANGKLQDQPKKLTYHWKRHPKHDHIWYEKQKKRYTRTGLAREVDLSYAQSLEGQIFDMFDYGRHVKTTETLVSPANPDGLYIPDPLRPITIAFDFGKVCCALFSQIDDYYNVDVFHEVILGLGLDSTGTTEDLAKATLATMDRYNRLNPLRGKDSSVTGYAYRFTGDPAGQTKPWQATKAFSDHDILSNHGLSPLQLDNVLTSIKRLANGVTLLQTMFSTRFTNRERIQIHNPDKVPMLIAALQGEYRYKVDRNQDVLDTIHEKHPYEDVMDCLRYTVLQFANTLPDNPASKKPERRKSNLVFPV